MIPATITSLNTTYPYQASKTAEVIFSLPSCINLFETLASI